MSMLEINNIDVFYGDFHALFDISMKIEKGSTVSLIGANGSGKSTLINAICGINHVRNGSIIFKGNNITNLKTSSIVSMGITVSPEGSRCFEKMTVQDNLLQGAYLCKKGDERKKRLADVYSLFPVLKEKAGQLATFLSGGQRQMLAIGRAMMTEPELLICDEISLGLAPVMVKDIYERLKLVKESGMTLLLIEQDVNRSLSFSDYSYVMLEGRIVMEGRSSELDIEQVNKAFFGIGYSEKEASDK